MSFEVLSYSSVVQGYSPVTKDSDASLRSWARGLVPLPGLGDTVSVSTVVLGSFLTVVPYLP